MNYKVIRDNFVNIKEKYGFIENTSNSLIELALINDNAQPIQNDESNTIVVPNGKYSYTLHDNEKLYVRCINRVSGFINVSEIKVASGEGGNVNITSVVVNVDDNVGIPSGNATLESGVLTLNLSNIKGVGIQSIDLKEELQSSSIYTITLTNGQKYDFTVKNGTAFNSEGQIEYPNGTKEYIE